VPPASGTSSSDLGRSGGVITPPADVDPAMKQTPPPSADKMPVIPPPGTPRGNPAIGARAAAGLLTSHGDRAEAKNCPCKDPYLAHSLPQAF
jgi:hypothetical protein